MFVYVSVSGNFYFLNTTQLVQLVHFWSEIYVVNVDNNSSQFFFVVFLLRSVFFLQVTFINRAITDAFAALSASTVLIL